MVYHYSQQLPSTVIKGVYKITTPNNVISNFWCFFTDILPHDNNKTLHRQIINND